MLIIVLVTAVLMFGDSEAILCYNCNSVDTPGCGNTLSNPGAIPTCTGSHCFVGRTTNNGPTVYVRACGQGELPPRTDVCGTVTVEGLKSYDCICDTQDLCNAHFSGTSHPSANGPRANDRSASVSSANAPNGASRILAVSAAAATAVVLIAKMQD